MSGYWILVVSLLSMSLMAEGHGRGHGRGCHPISMSRDLLSTVLHDFTASWTTLADELGMSKKQSLTIEHNERGATAKQRAALQTWFNDQAEPCWEDIVTALKSKAVGMGRLAEKIQGCYKCGKDTIMAHCVKNDGKCMRLPAGVRDRDRSEL